MAESWRAKANRYARGEFTNTELKIMLGGMVADQVIDVATFGALSRLKGQAVKKAILPLIKRGGTTAVGSVARAIPAIARTAVAGTRFVAMRHPYIAAAVVTYEVVKNRDQIEQLAREGWEVISDTGAAMAPIMQTEFERLITEGPRPSPGRVPPGFMQKKRPSKYNSGVKRGMRALKKSTSYGKRGTLVNPKKAFATVAKTVSKLMRGRKVSNKGPTGVVKRALPGFKTKVQVRKK